MHQFWLGLHILLAVCLIPGPSWANTSKFAKKSDLTVENVWQHEVQKNRQAMKIKILREMGFEPMSVLADEMALKIKKIYQNELLKTKALPSEEAREARMHIRSSLSKLHNTLHEMHKTMLKYKSNTIGAARARRQIEEHQIELSRFFRKAPFGTKVYALLQGEIQKNHNRSENVIFVRGELGADFKNEYKKAIQNPVKPEQLLKPYKEILPSAEDTAHKSSMPIDISKKQIAGRIIALLILLGLIKAGAATAIGSTIAVVIGTLAFAVTAAVLIFSPLFVMLMLANHSLDSDSFADELQLLFKYKLFREIKTNSQSKPTR